MGGVYISRTPAWTKEPPDQTAIFARRKAAGRIRRQGRRSQTRTTAHTAKARRRRAMAMVGPLVMARVIRPVPPAVKAKCGKAARRHGRPPITVKSTWPQITGFHGA